MSSKEAEAYWYSKNDLDMIMAENKLTLKVMTIGRPDPENFGQCYRGLETMMTAPAKRRQANIVRCLSAVFCEQDRQKGEKTVDPEMLATVSQGYTNMCVKSAIKSAREDAEIARAIANEPIVRRKRFSMTGSMDCSLYPNDDLSTLSAHIFEGLCNKQSNNGLVSGEPEQIPRPEGRARRRASIC